MSRTYRKNSVTGKKERDGFNTKVSSSCENHGSCPWCTNNRLFNQHKTDLKYRDEILKDEYYDILTTEDCFD